MHGNGHHEPLPQPPSHQEVARETMGKFAAVGSGYLLSLLITGILAIVGIIGLVIRISGGFDDRAAWGYHAGTMNFLLSTLVAMPIISAGLRLTKAHFRRPITRLAELGALSGIVMFIMLIFALQVLPTLEGRPDLWFDFPLGSPDAWEYIGVIAMVLSALLLAWTVALPDLAAARDHLPASFRQRLAAGLSVGWVGNLRAWRVQYAASLVLGAIFLLTYPLVHTMFSSDFHAGLVPGLKDAIFPATVTVIGLQGAVATLIIVMFVVRQAGYKDYIGVDQFWALSKPLLAFSLMWFYFWWASFLTFWYGRTDSEIGVINLLFLGPYKYVFATSMFLNFLGPLIALVWNPVRRSVWGPTVVSVGILIGTWLNCMRIYVSAASVPDSELFGHVLHVVPAAIWPDIADIMVTVGAVAAAAFLMLLAAKVVPVISMWEIGEGLRLVKVRRYYGRWVRVIAKSH